MKHGIYARSKGALETRARSIRRILRKMLVVAPWLTESDRPALRAWCELEFLAANVFAVLATEGVTTATGDGKKLLSDYRSLRATQNQIGAALGLTAVSRKALSGPGKQFDIVGALATPVEEDATDGDATKP